ncbi:hypothetical protein AB833_32520 [Chromatiales bacterium (ex Bugula neritina AB1)]|nr:hypothetical protein AB833_32520 [Chromatiales bacterium (ex Bugula neritina AB1)]
MNNTVASLIVDSLIANGIENLYCVPGVQNDHFFNALFDRQDRLKPIQTRHEQGAAYMALGAALATGKPQAFALVPGPGFLNGCAALCTAYALNAPVFGVIGQIPSAAIGKGLGLLHEIEGQFETLQTLTKYAERIVTGADAARQLESVWNALHTGRPRPVAVEVPVDVWLQKAAYQADSLRVSTPRAKAVDPAQIAAAVQLIQAAKCPLIAVGSGAQDSSALIREFASRVSAGVMAFRTGHGVLDSNDSLSITMPVGHKLWQECDLVIGLGTRLAAQKNEWGVDEDLKILQIDLDESELNRIKPASVGIHGELKTVLPAITSSLGQQTDRSHWRQRISDEKSAFSAEISNRLEPQLNWLRAIRNALPEDGIFVDELTQIGYVSRFAFPTRSPRTFLSTGYQGTLGYGIATGLGAAHARPDTPVVSIAGDGGAMFTIAELATAAHHNIPLNVVVMNDNAFGNVKGIQRDKYDARYIASDLTSPDFTMLARSFGVSAARVSAPDALQAELEKAIANPGPNLIEVTVDEFPSPWEYILLPTIRGK